MLTMVLQVSKAVNLKSNLKPETCQIRVNALVFSHNHERYSVFEFVLDIL